jgi:hypothetical protein
MGFSLGWLVANMITHQPSSQVDVENFLSQIVAKDIILLFSSKIRVWMWPVAFDFEELFT